MGFSLVTSHGGYSVVAVCRLLILVASLVAEHGLSRVHRLLFSASVFKKTRGTSLVVHWLSPCAPNAGDLGLISGQRIISHMPQLRPGAAKKKKKTTADPPPPAYLYPEAAHLGV